MASKLENSGNAVVCQKHSALAPRRNMFSGSPEMHWEEHMLPSASCFEPKVKIITGKEGGERRRWCPLHG